MSISKETAITWLGHSTFLVETPGGKTILLDPFLEHNPKCPPDRKQIDKCDLILISHAHMDHMADAAPVAARTGAQVVAIFELGEWLQAQGVQNVTPMGKGGTIKIGDIAVSMVNAHHSSSIDIDNGRYGGEPAGYVVKVENGFTFYHAGDTCVFGDMALIRDIYHPELAMLPIGDFYTMGPREASFAVRLLGVKHVLPMHYGTFPVLTGTPDELKALTQDVEGLTIHVPQPGETIS